MTGISIRHEAQGTKGRCVATVQDQAGHGELTYSRASDTLVIVDHTGFPDSLRGLGVGAALARAVVEDAREKGFRIMPRCPFFRSQFSRHSDWADVIES